MSGIDHEWDQTEVNEEGRAQRVADKIADGSYDAEVVDVSMFESAGGDRYCAWWFRVSGGVCDGAEVQRFGGVNSQTIQWHKQDFLRVLGRSPAAADVYDEERNQMPAATKAECMGVRVRITKRTRTVKGKTYEDVYIDHRLGGTARVQEPIGTRERRPEQPPESPMPEDRDAPSASYIEEDIPF